MPRRLSSLHARTICHETEDCDRVELALRTVVGDAQVGRSRTEGHFGNAIEVLEARLEDEGAILGVLGRMSAEDLEDVSSTLESRLDDSCHIFLRFDKQRAHAGELRLTKGEDVIALRIKVLAFPAKPAVAAKVMGAVLEELASSGAARGPA